MNKPVPYGNDDGIPDPSAVLTPREREVFQLVVAGYKNREMADRLQITLKTVEKHRKNMMDKLGVNSLSGLFRVALQCGLIDAGAALGDGWPGTVHGVGRYHALGEAKGIAVSGRYAYLGHGGGGLRVIDVGNPAAPVCAGGCLASGRWRVRSMRAQGKRSGEGGFQGVERGGGDARACAMRGREVGTNLDQTPRGSKRL